MAITDPRDTGHGATGPGATGDARPLWQRLGWLVVIWAASVAALGAVAWFLRLWIAP